MSPAVSRLQPLTGRTVSAQRQIKQLPECRILSLVDVLCMCCHGDSAGKNRPLDPDELEFLETLAQREAEEQRRVRSQEQADLDAYRQAVAAAAEAKAAADAAAEAEVADPLAESSGRDTEAAAGPGPGSSGAGLQGQTAAAAAASGRKPVSSKVNSKPLLPVLKPLVKVRPKGAAAEGSNVAAGAEQRDSKRARLDSSEQPQQQEQPPSVGLEGLLGGYASDSD